MDLIHLGVLGAIKFQKSLECPLSPDGIKQEAEDGMIRKNSPSGRGESSGGSDRIGFPLGKSSSGYFLPADTCPAVPSTPGLLSLQAGKPAPE